MSPDPAPAGAGPPGGSEGGPDGAPGGRVVMITGGTRGIGLACARWFLARGDKVAVTSRSGVVEEDVVEGPGQLLSLSCDVTDPAQVEAAFTAVETPWCCG